MADDLFEDLHNLEDRYYQDGYRLGVEDGSRAGRIEGRTFGLEKGFEKFFEMGRLQGKSQILEARLPTSTLTTESESKVKLLPANDRLAKHVKTLSALTELESLPTDNSEDSVSEFDDRFKRAQAKAKVIENIVGERSGKEEWKADGAERSAGVKLSRASPNTSGDKNMEDFGIPQARVR